MTIFSSTDRRAGAAPVAVFWGRVVCGGFLAIVAGAAVVQAQQSSAPPNALQGFAQNRDKPLKINAASLEVRNKDKLATFTGDVHLVQGDVDMRSATLVVFYDDQPPPEQPAPPPKGGKPSAAPTQTTPQQQNQQIKRVEAKGGVTVRVPQKDQTATGDLGIFDMRANTVTMLGHVVIAQGASVLRGDTLTVDMNSGASTLACDNKGGCTSGNRIQGVFSRPPSQPPAKDSAPAAAHAQNASPQTTRRSTSTP
jgi:lipopolysaccharide export system protein LptA